MLRAGNSTATAMQSPGQPMPELVTPTPRHSWGSPVTVLPADSSDGNERTERTCAHCGLVKITVHYARGLPGREWRTKEGKRWVGDATPPCLGAAG